MVSMPVDWLAVQLADVLAVSLVERLVAWWAVTTVCEKDAKKADSKDGIRVVKRVAPMVEN